MRERHLRRRCRALLRELDVPRPFGHRELCRRLSQHRGRPIRLMPFPIEQPGPSGIWLATDAADVIVYQSQTTAAHQEHIILHEVGHIIAGHDGEPQAAADPEETVRVHRRTAYDNRQEREAELIATILFEWSGRSDGLGEGLGERDPETVTDPHQAAALDRIANALTGGQGWS